MLFFRVLSEREAKKKKLNRKVELNMGGISDEIKSSKLILKKQRERERVST
jgi:hypothetical protein